MSYKIVYFDTEPKPITDEDEILGNVMFFFEGLLDDDYEDKLTEFIKKGYLKVEGEDEIIVLIYKPILNELNKIFSLKRLEKWIKEGERGIITEPTDEIIGSYLETPVDEILLRTPFYTKEQIIERKKMYAELYPRLAHKLRF